MSIKDYTQKSQQNASEKSPDFDIVGLSVRAVMDYDTYRYRGRYGWIYIGANSTAEALREAKRSTDEEISVSKLFKLNPITLQYENVSP
jgi:hypothetical protein